MALPTADELIKQYQAGGNKPLTTEQITGKPIYVDTLTTPVSPIPVSEAPMSNTGYGTAIEYGNTKTNAFNPSTTDVSVYKSMFDEIVGAPPSSADAYTQAQQSSDILAKQQAVAQRKAQLTRAQSELTGIQGEIAGFTTQAKAEEQALLKNAEGGLVTSAIFSRQRAKVQEQLAEKVLPYQSRILAKQAEIASLGGDVEQAQQLLSDAKNQLDTLFRLKSEDAANFYNYKKDLFNKAYEFADKKQTQALKEAETKANQQFQIEQGNRTAQRSAANSAWENGQSDLATRIGQIDPTSPTFQDELARLQGELKSKDEAKVPTGKIGEFQQIYNRLPESETEFNNFLARQSVATRAPAGAKPPTGIERQNLAFYNRADSAIKDLEQFENKIVEEGIGAQARLKLPTLLQSQEGKLYSQAQRTFTEARLRKESGAAIPESEFENDRQTYFIQPGDNKVTIEQKRQARQIVLNGMKYASGNAFEEFYGYPPSFETDASVSSATPSTLEDLAQQKGFDLQAALDEDYSEEEIRAFLEK